MNMKKHTPMVVRRIVLCTPMGEKSVVQIGNSSGGVLD
jgi:hypothetical protein